MGEIKIILDHYIPRKTIIEITCDGCKQPKEVRVEAVYRQMMRGKDKYTCPSCAGKAGWTDNKKKLASDRTKKQWDDPMFSGSIQGRAIAKEIRRLS